MSPNKLSSMNNIYHYCGHIISKDESGRFPKSNEVQVQATLNDYFDKASLDSCYGSLASGADILLAEAMTTKAAQLHLILPFAEHDFIKESVQSSGSNWVERFKSLINIASSVTQVFYKKPHDYNLSYALCSEVAMGLCLLRSIELATKASQITLWDRQKTQSIAGTYPDMHRWKLLNLESTYLDTKQPIKIDCFNDKDEQTPLPLDIVIFNKENSQLSTKVTSIKELDDYIKIEPTNIFIDLNHEVFGGEENTQQGMMSQRALGLISYHCHLNSNTQLLVTLMQMHQQSLQETSLTTEMDTTNFSLEMDLKQLQKVIQVNAIEAIVFYSGRILEATSTFCVTQLGEKAKSNVFANIEFINDYNLLDDQTRHWAHALRRLANQFRHILKPTELLDGKIAIILLDKWLDWLINQSPLVKMNNAAYSLLKDTQNELTEQFEWIDNWLENDNSEVITEQKDSPLLYQPVFASVICEELINSKQFNTVADYLSIALDSHPNDLRLNQLKGLLLSRTGKLQEAEALLKSLLKQAPNDDETVGILAGVIKKIWQDGDASRLNHWGKHYSKGWTLSKQRNTYLGINAAAFYLWSGDVENSVEIAKNIAKLYEHREQILKDVLNLSTKKMDYWDHATLAEAYLLAGLTSQAEEFYKELFTAAEFNQKPHNIPAKQLLLHLSYSSIESSKIISQLANLHAV